jgi:hypothetical protein
VDAVLVPKAFFKNRKSRRFHLLPKQLQLENIRRVTHLVKGRLRWAAARECGLASVVRVN